MPTISILGTGWLGLPLAQHLIAAGHPVKASTTSEDRLPLLADVGADPHLVDLDALTPSVRDFLQSEVLIVNIPYKRVDRFRAFIAIMEASPVRYVLFVSSTSVYQNVTATVTESDTQYHAESPLLEIESLFRSVASVQTTVVRFGGLIGYSRHPGRFFKSGRAIPNPEAPVNLIHRDDCVNVLHQIVAQAAWGHTLNACADTHPSRRAFYTRAFALAGRPEPPAFGPNDPASGKRVSSAHLRQVLSYTFQHPDLMALDFREPT
ncbi:MAG: SDR family NAD(P)-dependent oxidoreductase [Bacteroidota bacterium]